jgi:hypothetical protein
VIARAASALGIGIPAALIASFPAAVRCSASATSTVGLVSAWPALAGILVVPMAAAVLLLRGARDGLGELAGESAEDAAIDPPVLPAVPDEHVPTRASRLRAAVVGWGALVCAGLAPLGALLRARTHHHGLAGVTFAVLGLLFALGVAVLMRRALQLLSASSARTQRVVLGTFWTGLGVVVLVAGAVGGLRSASAAASTSLPALGANTLAIDLFAFVLAAAFASRPITAPRTETVLAWGSVLAVALVVLGAGSLGRVPGLEDELTRTSPLFALAAGAPAAPAPAENAAPGAPTSAD